MKSLILAVTLLFAPFIRAETEKILVVTGDQTASVQALLDQGWTVKHQAITASGPSITRKDLCFCLITLSPPTPETLAAAEKKRAEEAEKKKQEWNKKREEYLKQQENKNKVESDAKTESKK